MAVNGQHDEEFMANHADIHKVLVNEVLQTTSYTYLNVIDGNKTQWLAVPRIDANPGEFYYYKGGNEMKDFRSSELNRVFESVLFLGGIVYAGPDHANNEDTSLSKIDSLPDNGKLDIEIEAMDGQTTIAQLFSGKEKYDHKKVKVKGKVTRFSKAIMGKNWVHLQDGTEYDGNFDLVITTDETVNVDDIVTFEGIIATDKDFGYGYFYSVLMEEAKIVK